MLANQKQTEPAPPGAHHAHMPDEMPPEAEHEPIIFPIKAIPHFGLKYMMI